MANGMRAAIFNRESKGKGSSIDDQERENRASAAELGARVLFVLGDVVGASKFTRKQRTGWPEVVELVRSGAIDLLVVWEVSRADREMDRWVPFITACGELAVRIHITSLEMTYDPRKAAHRKALLDMGSSAEHETGQLSERSRKGIRGAVRAGKAHGPSAFGYTREYGPIVDGKRTFTEVRNEHIGVAVEVITRVANRDPISAIERDLNARPAAERGDRTWTDKTIKYVATNPAYIAMREYDLGDGLKLHPGNWPPASDAPGWRATFERAQAVLSEPGRRTTGPTAGARHLLSYTMVCEVCREHVVSAHPTGEAVRYRCPKGCNSVPMGDADAVAFSTVFALRYRPDVFELLGGDPAALADADAEVKRLERDMDSARAAYARHGDDEAFERRLQHLRPALDEAQRRAAEVRQASAAFGDLADLFDSLPDGDGEEAEYAAVRERWESRSIIQRRAIVKRCFARVVLHKAPRRLSRHATPEQRLALASERIEFVLPGGNPE